MMIGLRLAFTALLAAAFALPAVGASSGLSAADRDPTISACDDFYRYANGGWLDRARIPADRVAWSSYDEVDARTEEVLKALLEGAAAGGQAEHDPYSAAVGSIYGTCMNMDARERAGVSPLRFWLAAIEGIDSQERLASALGELHRVGVRFPFRLYGTPDPTDSGTLIAELWQNGPRLPVHQAYDSESTEAVELRAAYRSSLAALFVYAGSSPEEADAQAESTLRLESALARNTMPRVQTRDPAATTNRRRGGELLDVIPGFSWEIYFKALGIKAPAVVNVGQPRYFEALAGLLQDEPVAAWRSYLRAQLLLNAAPYLGREAQSAVHSLYAALTGVREQPPLWRTCLDATKDLLPEVLGKVYADRVLDEGARRRVAQMAENLLAVMGERISASTWMSEPTRRAALAKLATLDLRLVAPAAAPRIDGLELASGGFVASAIAAARWTLDDGLRRIGNPVDRSRWPLPAYRTTGAYVPSLNLVVYPAAKFQPPFFDPAVDDALNYGAIGATLAHEILHAFDDEGRQYDARGNLRDWWAPGDASHFAGLAERLRRQFDAFLGVGDAPVDGALTLGENIADLGGLTVAYHALRRSIGDSSPRRIDGLSPEQRFFFAWARNWREVATEEVLRSRLSNDVHAPARWRTNGPLSNLSEFATAFGCSSGDPMSRPAGDRVEIW